MENGFKLSSSDTHWMGKGVYFYDNAEQANSFNAKTKKASKGTVLKADVEVEKKKVLDLRKKTDNKKFAAFIERQNPKYENSIRLKNTDTDINMNIEKELDKIIFSLKCALFDYYCDEYNINLAICEHNTHPGSLTQVVMKSLSIDHNVEVQYCAKDLKIIKDINYND
jgi:hypothetical protein